MSTRQQWGLAIMLWAIYVRATASAGWLTYVVLPLFFVGMAMLTMPERKQHGEKGMTEQEAIDVINEFIDDVEGSVNAEYSVTIEDEPGGRYVREVRLALNILAQALGVDPLEGKPRRM